MWVVQPSSSTLSPTHAQKDLCEVRHDCRVDSKYFAIVLKHPDQKCVLIAHICGRSCSEEVVRLYHDVPLQPLYGNKIEFLLARLAWTIFDSVKFFLEQNVPRRLKLKGENGEVQENLCSPQGCRSHALRCRSTSPSRRARATRPAPVEGYIAHKRQRSSSTLGSESTTSSKLAFQERTLNSPINPTEAGRRDGAFRPVCQLQKTRTPTWSWNS